MSQISMPIRILLVGAVVFLAAWFTVLKPTDPVVPVDPAAPATSAPAQPGPGAGASKADSFRDTAKAGAAAAEKDALGAANATIEDVPGAPAAPAATSPSTTSSAPSATATRAAKPVVEAVPAKAVANLPRDVREGLKDRKVVVLGVLATQTKPWNHMADDDRAVRKALSGVNRYGGKVVVEPVTIGSLTRYEGMLEALNVTQSPTVVVIDSERKAVALTGYLDRLSINQAIADARRFSTEPRIKDPFLAKMNRVCGHYAMRYSRWSLPTVPRARGAAVGRLIALAGRDRRSMARLAAPAKWRGLKAQMLRTQDLAIGSARRADAAFKRGNVAGALTALEAGTATYAAMDRRLNAVGLTACTSKRTS